MRSALHHSFFHLRYLKGDFSVDPVFDDLVFLDPGGQVFEVDRANILDGFGSFLNDVLRSVFPAFVGGA